MAKQLPSYYFYIVLAVVKFIKDEKRIRSNKSLILIQTTYKYP